MKNKSPSTLLGLAVDGHRLEGAVLRRSNGSLKVTKHVAGDLALNLLNDDPELVGREIRNLLEEAGVREKSCLFCLPVGWLNTRQVKLPDLPEEDLASFLQLEAERGFHFGHDTLSIVTSRFETPTGERYATQMAVSLAPLNRLEQVLRSARLRPVSFTPGVTALMGIEPDESEGLMTLLPHAQSLDIFLTGGGGAVALRSVDAPSDAQDSDIDHILREIRITLGQVPASLHGRFRTAHWHSQGGNGSGLRQDLTLELSDLGYRCEEMTETFPMDLAGRFPTGTKPTPVVVAAARHLRGTSTGFEFLPPRLSAWQRFGQRVSARKLAWAGAAAAAVILGLGGGSLWQYYRWSKLERQWAAVRPNVEELDSLQQRIRKFRPWFDQSMASLTLLRNLAESFPEDGRVTAKTLELRDQANVSCTGTAEDHQALLDTMDRLRAVPGVGDMKVDQIRGKAPLQFALNFQWKPGGDRDR